MHLLTVQKVTLMNPIAAKYNTMVFRLSLAPGVFVCYTAPKPKPTERNFDHTTDNML